jgi:hypothetical protein
VLWEHSRLFIALAGLWSAQADLLLNVVGRHRPQRFGTNLCETARKKGTGDPASPSAVCWQVPPPVGLTRQGHLKAAERVWVYPPLTDVTSPPHEQLLLC